MNNYGRMAGRRHIKGKPFKLFSDQLPTVDFNKMYLDEQYGKHTYEIQHISNTRTNRRGTDADNYSLPSPRRPDWDEYSLSDYSRAKSESPTHPLSPNVSHIRRNIRKRFGVVGKQIHDAPDPMSPHYFERLSEKRNSLIGVAPFAASPLAMELVSGVKPLGANTQSHNRLRRITTPTFSAKNESDTENDDSSHRTDPSTNDSRKQQYKGDAISILRNQMRLGVKTHLKGKAKKESKKETNPDVSQSSKVSIGHANHISTDLISHTKGQNAKVGHPNSKPKDDMANNVGNTSQNTNRRQTKICAVEPFKVGAEHISNCNTVESSPDDCNSEKAVQSHEKHEGAMNIIISTRGILKTNVLPDKTNKVLINLDEQKGVVTQNVDQSDVHVPVQVTTPLNSLNESLHIPTKEDYKRRRVNFHETESNMIFNESHDSSPRNYVKQDIQIPAKITVTQEQHDIIENDVKEQNRERKRGKTKRHNKIKFPQDNSYLPRLAVLPAIQRETDRDNDSQLGNQWQPVKKDVPEPHLLAPESIPVDYVLNCSNTRGYNTPVSELDSSRCSYRKYTAQTPALDHSDFTESTEKPDTTSANEVHEMDYIAKVIDVFEEFEKTKEDGDDEIDRSMTGEELLKAYRLWDRKRRVFPTGYRNIEPPEEHDDTKASKQFGYAKPYKINNDILENKEQDTPNTVL